MEGLSLNGAADLGKGGEDRRLRQMPRLARGQRGFNPIALHKGHPKPTDKTLPYIGLINDAKNRLLPIIQGNQSAPGGRATDIPAGAINRVKHPRQTGCAKSILRLFANHRVLGPLRFQECTHDQLSRFIGLGDRIKPLRPFILRHQCWGAKPLKGMFGRPIRQLRGKR